MTGPTNTVEQLSRSGAGRLTRFVAGCWSAVVLATAAGAIATPASAHPHIWVSIKTTVLYDKGTIVDKSTKEQPPFIYGFPFPDVDANDPKAVLAETKLLLGQGDAAQGQVVGLRAAAGKENGARRAGQDVGHGLAGAFKRVLGTLPEAVHRRGVAEMLGEIGQHGLHDAWVDRRGRCIIHVNGGHMPRLYRKAPGAGIRRHAKAVGRG